MSRTFKQIRARKLKTAIIERRVELGGKVSTSIAVPGLLFQDTQLTDDWFECGSGRVSLRHGNKRHSAAKDKVRQRRAERRAIKNATEYYEDCYPIEDE